MADTMIQDVAALGPFRSQRKTLAFKTTKQVVSALSGSGEALATYLKTNREALAVLVGPDAICAVPGVAAVRFSTGVRLDRIPTMPQAFSSKNIDPVQDDNKENEKCPATFATK